MGTDVNEDYNSYGNGTDNYVGEDYGEAETPSSVRKRNVTEDSTATAKNAEDVLEKACSESIADFKKLQKLSKEEVKTDIKDKVENTDQRFPILKEGT